VVRITLDDVYKIKKVKEAPSIDLFVTNCGRGSWNLERDLDAL